MTLEEKLKKLEKEFKGASKVLIKSILHADDVKGDLTKARQRLQSFVTAISKPSGATCIPGPQYVHSGRQTPSQLHNDGRSSPILHSQHTELVTELVNAKPKLKPKPNWARQHGKSSG